MTQTWVPTLDLEECAAVLDVRRLGAQRGEALIVLRALVDPTAGGPWTNHPAVRMWRGHAGALCSLGIEVSRRWRALGHDDGCLPQFVRGWRDHPGERTLPGWWGRSLVHRQQRRALVGRAPEHYAAIWPDEPPEPHALHWPVDKEGRCPELSTPYWEPVPAGRSWSGETSSPSSTSARSGASPSTRRGGRSSSAPAASRIADPRRSAA